MTGAKIQRFTINQPVFYYTHTNIEVGQFLRVVATPCTIFILIGHPNGTIGIRKAHEVMASITETIFLN